MKVILQRVKEASVVADDQRAGSIENGYLVLVGFTHTDKPETCARMAQKIAALRIMADDNDRMNKTLADVNGKVLAVPQFTLYADTSGRRPGFMDAAKPEEAKNLFDYFVAQLIANQVSVEQGVFGAHMVVASKNDGPLTLILEQNEAAA